MNNLLFDFIVDKATRTVTINREFDAELSLVWDAFTKKEILDQWWAPKPYLSMTKAMDFKVGGRRFYAMVSPEGQKHWAIQKYTSITPKTNFKYLNAFADKDENPELPGSDWDYNFTSVLIFVCSSHTFRNIICHQHTLTDWQSNMHNFIFFFFCYRESRTCEVFKTDNLCKLSAKYGFVKSKCFFGIAIEVNVGINECHNSYFLN